MPTVHTSSYPTSLMVRYSTNRAPVFELRPTFFRSASLSRSHLMSSRPLDPAYFSTKSWATRVQDWLQNHSSDSFLDGNVQLTRQIMEHQESGLRMVVNIS